MATLTDLGSLKQKLIDSLKSTKQSDPNQIVVEVDNIQIELVAPNTIVLKYEVDGKLLWTSEKMILQPGAIVHLGVHGFMPLSISS